MILDLHIGLERLSYAQELTLETWEEGVLKQTPFATLSNNYIDVELKY